MSNRVLFVSHSASRTGAPIVLLEIVRWLRANTDTQCSALFWSGGPLVEEFEELVRCRVLHPEHAGSMSVSRQVWERLSMRPDETTRQRGRLEKTVRASARALAAALDEPWMRQWRKCDLVYANTVGSARAVRALQPTAPLLAHIHEPAYSVKHVLSQHDVATMIGGRHRIIAASGAVRETLVNDFVVDPSRVEVVHEFIKPPSERVSPTEVDGLRASLGIPPDAFVVGGSGVIEWRKGTDLFVQLARKLATTRPGAEIHCVWVGDEHPSERLLRQQIDIDVAKSGAAHRMHFVGSHANPWPFYELFDAFALTSRDDPFPLVALEAASLARPMLCFADAGGMQEFAADGRGVIVPYLGLDEMAAEVLRLYDDPSLRISIGERAAARVREAHTADAVVPRIADLITAAAEGTERSPRRLYPTPPSRLADPSR